MTHPLESLQDKIARVVADPVEIVPYNSHWPDLFTEEKERLRALFPRGLFLRIEHFGSTAVPGLCAKPVVDILVVTASLEAVRKRAAPILERDGCDYFWRPTFGEDGPPWYAWFIRRDLGGKRTHHIHVVEDSPEFAMHLDRLLFRDYLRANPETAERYGALKMRLAGEFASNRVRYTRAKGDFIQNVMRRIRQPH